MATFGGKIFGVGLNKTGTSSLTRACEILGFSAMHHSMEGWPSKRISAAAESNIAAGMDLFTGMPEVAAHDAFFDVRIVEQYFSHLDEDYPDSRFILHVRDLDSWLDSRERHVHRNIAAMKVGKSNRTWLTVDRDAWATEWHQQCERVRSHFAGREDVLLEIDVAGGDGWEKLAPFLGRAVPGVQFPHQNKAPSTWRRAGRLGRRWVRAIRA
jgi:hypothetical protein